MFDLRATVHPLPLIIFKVKIHDAAEITYEPTAPLSIDPLLDGRDQLRELIRLLLCSLGILVERQSCPSATVHVRPVAPLTFSQRRELLVSYARTEAQLRLTVVAPYPSQAPGATPLCLYHSRSCISALRVPLRSQRYPP